MRALVRIEDEERAYTLGDALFAEGVQSRVDSIREGGFVVWVHDELDMDRAKALLTQFEEAPDDPRWSRARREAQARRKEEEQQGKEREKKSRHRTVNMRKRWQSQSGWGRLTLGLIIVSVAVTLLAGFGQNREVVAVVSFSFRGILERFEVWRVLSPIFLHLGFIHLFFNMYMLKLFGVIVEHKQSTLVLGAMVLVMGVVSNVAQAVLVHEAFGGMSGVVYGLFGYLWIRGRFDPSFGVALPRSTVIILLGWMALGFAGFMQMANIAHLGGLLVGMAWAGLAALRARSR